ncbi:MAG: cyclic nucleotide-binding domain-containing protein [Alphaproteobacteria bacterium]
MGLKEEVDLLRRIPLLAKVDTAQIKLLAFASERLTFEAEQTLFRQGEEGDGAYLIISGEADVVVEAPSGPIQIARVERNAFIGEIAILCDVPRTASVIAHTRLETLKISKELFFRMVTEFPVMAVEVMRVLAERLEHTTELLRDARTDLASAKAGDA